MSGVHCANCQRQLATDKPYVVDERTDDVYCNKACFNDWAADNAAEIIAYYARLNTYVAN